jgi:hypothetical protein
MRSLWALLIGVAIGAHFVYGAWLGLILRPLWVDSDIRRAYELLSEGGLTPLSSSLAVTGILFVATVIVAFLALRSVERRFDARTVEGWFARFSLTLFVLGLTGPVATFPGSLLALPIRDAVVVSEVQEGNVLLLVSVVNNVALGSLILAGTLGVAAVVIRAVRGKSKSSGAAQSESTPSGD